MKMNSISDIDHFLRKECDFGHLLDYLNQRKKIRDPYWLPIIDVLRLIPEFDDAIQGIKKELKIEPQENIKKLENLVGKAIAQKYIRESKNVARGLMLPKTSVNQWKRINKNMSRIADEFSPQLTKQISKIRLFLFGKLQPLWHSAIEKYILFEIIDTTPFIFRRPLPEIKTKVDPKTNETYLEMRIYADTNISVLRRVSWWKKMQKLLPNYISLEKWDKDIVLKRFLHYILKKRLDLKHKIIYDWLEEKEFTITDYCYASQEMKRFEILLKKS